MSSERAPRVFISYSHKDEDWKDRLVGHLGVLERQGLVDLWEDRRIGAGQKWQAEIEAAMARARVAVLVVSADFLTSEFILGQEVPRLLDRQASEGLDVIPLIARPCAWQAVEWLAELQVRPLDGRALSSGEEHQIDADLAALAAEIGKLVQGSEGPGDDEPNGKEALTAYAAWARRQYSHLELIGIDAGDVQIELDEVYVPLRMVHHTLDGDVMGLFRGTALRQQRGEREDVEIESVLEPSTPRHALIFGEPGSGKTTALIKLHQLCWAPGPEALGLAAGTVPVFLRLRHLRRELLDEGLAAFIEHEVAELSGGRLQGFGETLWDHRRLLLLFDGLDEIANADYRAEVLRRIGWCLGEDDAADVRAVVSCRRLGLPPREADRDRLFRTLEVRPFQDEQIAQLVKLWFRELARRDRITQATADQRVAMVLGALTDRRVANQQLLEMVSNPLLLTLLCVVVLLGNEIPKKRVRFYEQCLDVLLDRWPRQRGKEAPVDLNAARDALGRLAFHLHSTRRKDDLGWAEAVAELMTALGDRPAAKQFFEWLHGDVGLLVDYTEKDYGFVHLGIQEHLTARHLIAHPEDLEVLAGDFDESWWAEVFLQLSALSERTGFDRLMSRLLHHTDALERRAGLLRDCLRETRRPELAAFIRLLEEGDETRQEAALRLLRGIEHRPPGLLAAAERLASGAGPAVRRAAEQLVASRDSPEYGTTERLGLLFDPPDDEKLAGDLADRLGSWHGGLPAVVARGTGRESGDVLDSCGTVVVLLGSSPADWSQARPLRKIYGDKHWLAVRLPGAPRPAVPEVFSDCEVLDWRRGEEDALIDAIVARLPSGEAAREPAAAVLGDLPTEDAAREFTEPVTEMMFLPVPAGSFVMGSDDLWTAEDRKRFLEETLKAPTPACRVRLSAFRLARTAVTNAQYGRFLEATGHREPESWRDRRFSDAEQPVVNVSQEDAVAFCKWLTAENAEGRIFTLPSEAQWEYAARGPESRLYPWGDDPPTDALACFGLDHQEDKPAAAGSYPDGAGPFGHLDLAGGVWEWCRDAWEPDLSRWAKGEPLDPVGEKDPNLRPLRGGCWLDDAADLRSAVRLRDRPDYRVVGVGFRVLCAPPSSTS